MKFPLKKFLSVLMIGTVLSFLVTFSASAQTAVNDDNVFFENYTYWNDISGGNTKTPVYMQPIYRASNIYGIAESVGSENFGYIFGCRRRYLCFGFGRIGNIYS